MNNLLEKINKYAELIKIGMIFTFGIIMMFQLYSIKKSINYIDFDTSNLESSSEEIQDHLKYNKYYSCISASKLDPILVKWNDCDKPR